MPAPDFIAYIIGPYRAPTISGVRRNIEAARELAELLWRNNIPTICSHLNTAYMDGIAPDQVFLDGDLVLLIRCDCVLVLPNSDKSTGAQREIQCAITHTIPVIHVPPVWRDPEAILVMVRSAMDLAMHEQTPTRKDLTS